MSAPIVQIDPLSLTSLYLKLNVNGNLLSTATGIIVEHEQRYYLVSNYHVFAGRHAESGRPLSPTAGIPDEARIAHHIKPHLGTWRFVGEPLINAEGSPRWIAHPAGPEIDVAGLELRNIPSDAQIYPFSLDLADVDILTQPAMAVSVIGFPLGLRPNAFFPIWKTGHIATDPDLPYGGKPAFLIDATTRSGMSGSPVVIRTSGAYMDSDRRYVVTSETQTKFLGIYSGRLTDEIEIGCVWRPQVITELLAQGRSPDP